MLLHTLKILKKKPSAPFLMGLTLVLLTGCACNDPLKPETKNNAQDSSNDSKSGRNQVAELETIKIANKLDFEITEATAIINPLEGNKISGIVKFIKTDEGVLVIADIDGLTPGEHGFHIHEFGDCNGKNSDSIGAHYNPTHQTHGKPDSIESHVGDLGNLNADQNGHAHYEAVNKVIKLQGRYSILGRSVIIHADKDDYVTQPAGASGVKIGCGVIEPISGK